MAKAQTSPGERLKERLSDRYWRLNNLYYIKDKSGKKVKFKMNWAQNKIYNEVWYFNIILKARQLGFTTFIMIYFLDACLFNSNHSAGVIAHTKDDAIALFDDKIKFAYNNLPDWIKASRHATQDSARKLEFSNGSSLVVGTSLRSGTFQKLLVSELGKLSAQYPDKAKEVKSGALNTVEAGQQIFVESTAEGKMGLFYDLCELARRIRDSGKKLTSVEPKFHFFAWFDNPEYTMSDDDADITHISKDTAKYLDKMPHLTRGQRAWYAAKELTQGEDMKKEYPSNPKEAFEGSLLGAFYTKQMTMIRKQGQITNIPYDRRYPVNTFWDIGQSRDMMVIWFHQYIDGRHVFINYHESNGQGWEHYALLLKDMGYNYGTHFFPHDGAKRVVGGQIFTTQELAEQQGINPIILVERTSNRYHDIINFCVPTLPICWFDRDNCARGITHLDNYKRRWDKPNSMWLNDHQHNEASHGSDGMRTFVMAKVKDLILPEIYGYDWEEEEFYDDDTRNSTTGY